MEGRAKSFEYPINQVRGAGAFFNQRGGCPQVTQHNHQEGVNADDGKELDDVAKHRFLFLGPDGAVAALIALPVLVATVQDISSLEEINAAFFLR